MHSVGSLLLAKYYNVKDSSKLVDSAEITCFSLVEDCLKPSKYYMKADLCTPLGCSHSPNIIIYLCINGWVVITTVCLYQFHLSDPCCSNIIIHGNQSSHSCRVYMPL